MKDTTLVLNNHQYCIKRYPVTTNKSLRAWSNAELLALDYIEGKTSNSVHFFNDRFGVWNVVLNKQNTTTVWTYASQQKAILQNLKLNSLALNTCFKTPLDDLEQVELALVKIPKSLELFELFLQQIHKASNGTTEVVCCFMTKYFSASILKIASTYFMIAEQTQAWKKARLLILKQPKSINHYKELFNTIHYKEFEFQQYFGVFSSGKIDIGTQFLLEHLQIHPQEQNILDLASGNGIIAHQILNQQPQATLTLIDDFNLAVASSQLNITNEKARFLCTDSLSAIATDYFDLIVSNPPFHFEYENNIEVALSLFKQVVRVLKPTGRFVLVANSHLNYKTHLQPLFNSVNTIIENNQFVVYECLSKL